MGSSEEKRSSDRLPLDNFQRVRDADNGNLIGYLGDISLVGLKVLGKVQVEQGRKMRLRLNYICLGGDRETAEVDVESVWERDDGTMPYREIGFRFLDLPTESRGGVERIMADLKQRETNAAS